LIINNTSARFPNEAMWGKQLAQGWPRVKNRADRKSKRGLPRDEQTRYH